MKPLQTGIAVALAVGVVGVFFIFPGLSPFPSPSSESAAADEGLTNDQLASTTPTTMPDTTSLEATDEVVGTGSPVEPGDTIMMSYVGSLTDGTVFDSTEAHGGTPLTLIVAADGSLHTPDGNGLIAGWSQGIVGMKEGGKRKLIIPSSLGYGAQAVGNVIPPNATLVFEVELTKVEKPK